MRIALLDIVDNTPGAGELRARSYELLGIAPVAAMVDVGCGSGRAVAEMAEVGIPEVLLPDFRDHVRRWAEPGSYGRVFVGPKGATPRRSNFNRLWKSAAVKAGIAPEVGLHFHDLRHTGNHLTKGASLKDVMRRLGHASTRAALIYQHADRDSERAIAASLSETITAALAGSNGHAAGTAAAGGDSGRDPEHVQDPR